MTKNETDLFLRAVAGAEYNTVIEMMAEHHGFLHHLGHHFDQALEVEALTRSHVQLQCDGIQLLLAVPRQVCPFGQVLADQAVDVFVAIALPGAMRATEVDGDTGSLV